MKKGLLGEKIGMTQVWAEDGRRVAVTAVKAGPCPVVQVKTAEKDGYSAVQIAYNQIKEKSLTSPQIGHLKAVKEKTGNVYSELAELRDFPEEKTVGDELTLEQFEKGEKVTVRGVSKGKGFQGVVKRYNFGGGRKTHGSTFHRSTGSVGAGTYPGRVIKGKKLPGRMGGKTSTTRNVEVIDVIADESIVLLKGSIPGPTGSQVFIYTK